MKIFSSTVPKWAYVSTPFINTPPGSCLTFLAAGVAIMMELEQHERLAVGLVIYEEGVIFTLLKGHSRLISWGSGHGFPLFIICGIYLNSFCSYTFNWLLQSWHPAHRPCSGDPQEEGIRPHRPSPTLLSGLQQLECLMPALYPSLSLVQTHFFV